MILWEQKMRDRWGGVDVAIDLLPCSWWLTKRGDDEGE